MTDRYEPGVVALLEHILVGTRPLPGAACVGSAAVLFDPPRRDEPHDQREYRRRAAAQLCRRCPERLRCPARVESQIVEVA